MIIEGSTEGRGLGIEYHAREIRNAIEAAHLDGYHLDVADEKEIRDLDLNANVRGEYVKIIRDGVLLRDMEVS